MICFIMMHRIKAFREALCGYVLFLIVVKTHGEDCAKPESTPPGWLKSLAIWSHDQAKAESPRCPQPSDIYPMNSRSVLNEWKTESHFQGFTTIQQQTDTFFPRYLDVLWIPTCILEKTLQVWGKLYKRYHGASSFQWPSLWH